MCMTGRKPACMAQQKTKMWFGNQMLMGGVPMMNMCMTNNNSVSNGGVFQD